MYKLRFIPLLLLLLTGCNSSGDGSARQGSAVEQAFFQAMVPHHQMALEMAEMALDTAQLAQIKTMAQAVIAAQSAEITQMRQMHQRMFGGPLVADDMAHGKLSLTMAEAGMDMNMDDLMGAESFDRQFIDLMIRHHQGAIRMARAVLKQSSDAELRTLAERIISAQSAEIMELNALRLQHYGAESPAGGVPVADSAAPAPFAVTPVDPSQQPPISRP